MSNIHEITEEEKLSLEYYTSRKNDQSFGNKDYSAVNKFLRQITNNSKPATITAFMSSPEDLKDVLKNIENLFSVACKYGATHDLPPRIFRGYDGASKVITDSKKDNYRVSRWEADQFLSCSRSEGETRAFSNLEVMCMDIDDTHIYNHEIPFIDVNQVIGSDQMFDEAEILLPPFLDLVVKGQEKTKSKVYYDLEIEPFFAKQTMEEEMTELTDDDLSKYYELSQDYYRNSNQSVKEELLNLQWKIKSYLHSTLSQMQFYYMVENKDKFVGMFDEELTQVEQEKISYY